jgi:hypothetical protein
MGGFKAPRTVYKLVFDDEDMAGLEVRARGMSISQSAEHDAFIRDADIAASFARYLDSWNVTDDDDNEVPATLDGVRSLEVPFLSRIVAAWRWAGIKVEAPLALPSHDGEHALEESMPMETLSPSLAS